MNMRSKKTEGRIVLFVDDDEIVLNSLESGLQDESYNKLFVNSSNKALEILRREEVHVIVVDDQMPDMSGLELIRIVKKEYPRIVCMVLTGYSQDTSLQKAVEQGEIFKLIAKPWKFGLINFETIIRQALEQYDLHKID